MKVLVLNGGSSTLKFQMIQSSESGAMERKLARGIVDRIGGPASYHFEADGAAAVKNDWLCATTRAPSVL